MDGFCARRFPMLCLGFASIAFLCFARARASTLTSAGTTDLSPGIDVYSPQHLALNRTANKVYVSGNATPIGTEGIKVIDTASGQVLTGIDLGRYSGAVNPFIPGGLAVDESAAPAGNKLYVVGQNGTAWYLRVIDCATDANLTGEGTDVFLPMGGTGDETFSSVAVNPANHKVYVAEQNGDIIVIDGPNRQVLKKLTPNAGTFLVAAPELNKVFVVNRNGGAVIDSSSDTITPLALTFVARDGVFNSTDNRLYFVGYSTSTADDVFVVDANTGQLVASRQDVPQAPTSFTTSVTVVPEENTLYVSSTTTLTAFDTRDLSVKAALPQHAIKVAYDPANTRKLFLLHDPNDATRDLINAVGVFDREDFSLQAVTVGYRPADLATNSRTHRVYVADELANEVVALDSDTRAVVARVQLTPGVQHDQRVAVSERLNRIYVPRLINGIGSPNFGGAVDIYDGDSNTLRSSIPVDVIPGHVGIDDTRHRIYVAGYRASGSMQWSAFLYVYDQDTEARLATLNLGPGITPVASAGIAVNQVTGRVYLSTALGLSVIDGNTAARIAQLSILAGPVAIDRVTNKVYVAHPAQGGNGYELTVIDGATNTIERAVPIPTQTTNNDFVNGIAVDEVTNTIYVADAPANYLKQTGQVIAFDANQDYAVVGSTSVGMRPSAAAFDPATRQLFVSNNYDGTVSVLQSDVARAPAMLANISTRAFVGADDAAIIGGFIVDGPAGSTKRVLVRAIGPSLSQAGVANPLADTVVELHDSAGNVITNDDSTTGDQQEIEATGIPPTDSRESALIATLPSGPCTAIIRGKSNSTGVALIEVYDLDSASAATLANISTRGFVGTGDDVLIGGIIVSGSEPIQTEIRAIGPSLATSGIAMPLTDPILELRDPNGALIAANDDWQENAAEISATQLAPSDSRESALAEMLYPGRYTAIVRGKNDNTGVALVEAYNLH